MSDVTQILERVEKGDGKAAEELLASRLPPDLTYSFTSRHRVPSDNPAHSMSWICTIDGGAAGEGTTPIQAARKAIEAWTC